MEQLAANERRSGLVQAQSLLPSKYLTNWWGFCLVDWWASWRLARKLFKKVRKVGYNYKVIKQFSDSNKKIIKRVLIGGVILGIASSILRMALTLLGVLAIPVVMGGRLSEQPTNELMAALVPVAGAITPYLIGVGAASVFLYVFLFPAKESRGALVGWGILMTLYLIAKIFIAWL